MEEESVQVEETTEVSQPEENTETTEAEVETEVDTEEASEETENTTEVEPEKPKSRANERIRELIAQKKALEAQLQAKEPEIEGVEEGFIDPQKYASSLEKRTSLTAQKIAQSTLEYYRAEQDFPLVKDNKFVRSRAGDLVNEGYNPVQAAELATLEWQQTTGQEVKKTVQRKTATSNLKANAQIPSAGKAVSSSGGFTRADIAKMTPSEYVANQYAIQAQIDKYGPESLE